MLELLNLTCIKRKNNLCFNSYNSYNHRVTCSMPLIWGHCEIQINFVSVLTCFSTGLTCIATPLGRSIILSSRMWTSQQTRCWYSIVTMYVIVMITWDCLKSVNMLIYNINHVSDDSSDTPALWKYMLYSFEKYWEGKHMDFATCKLRVLEIQAIGPIVVFLYTSWFLSNYKLNCMSITFFSTSSTCISTELRCIWTTLGRGPRVVVSTAAFHARVRGSVPGLGGLKEIKCFFPFHVWNSVLWGASVTEK